MRRPYLLACALVAVGAEAAPAPWFGSRTPSPQSRLEDRFAARLGEIHGIQEKAIAVARGIGDVVTRPDIADDPETLKLVQDLVQQLKELNMRLARLEDDVEALKGKTAEPVKPAKAKAETKTSGYVHFQYRDSDQVDRNGEFVGSHALSMRRVRLSQTVTVSPRASAKISIDAAGAVDGGTVQLRDAMLISQLDPGGTQLVAGQFLLPTGYELGRSSSEREFPERAVYNRRIFDGDRVRGVYVKHPIGEGITAYAGLSSSLTVNDAEQRGRPPANRLAGFGGLKWKGDSVELGIGLFGGARPRFETRGANGAVSGFSPEVDRRFLVLDGTIIGIFDPNLSLRVEAVLGSDRVASSTPRADRVAHDMSGWQTQLGYTLNPRNQIHFRAGQFDPNRDTDFDAVTEIGAAYRYMVDEATTLSLAYEIFEDPSLRTPRFGVLTARYQLKF